MKNHEREPQKILIEEAQGVIERAEQGIEDEFSRTRNTWLECFGSRVFALETYLSMDSAKTEVGTERHQSIIEKLESLKERLAKLKDEYPDKDTVPPDETKRELLDSLKDVIN